MCEVTEKKQKGPGEVGNQTYIVVSYYICEMGSRNFKWEEVGSLPN